MLPIFDPTLNHIQTLFEFTNQKKIHGIVPGYIYFHFDKPRLVSDILGTRKKSILYGRDCLSKKENEYFRIHVDVDGNIEALTYLGKREIAIENMSCLYGMNEKVLNRFVARYDEDGAGIPDFVQYDLLT